MAFQDPPHVIEGMVMRFSAKCEFFTWIGIHKSDEHNSESANNYSGKTQGAPEPPLGGRWLITDSATSKPSIKHAMVSSYG